MINVQGNNINPVALNGANTYSGTTTIGGGALGGGPILLGVSSVGNPGAITSGPFGTGTVIFNETASASNAVVPVLEPIGADRTVANAITMTSGFFVANAAGTAFNLSLTGPISLGATGRVITNNLVAGAALTLGSAASPSTITLSSAANQPLTFQSQGVGTTIVNDNIQNNAAIAGIVAVTSGGTVILNGAGTYTGGTTVNGGRLLVNNMSGSGTGTGTVTVTGAGTGAAAFGTGGTLGGGNSAGSAGFIAGSVTISSTTAGSQGGVLSPGNSIGTLTVNAGTMTWNPGGQYAFEHDVSASAPTAPVGGTTADFINGTGATLSLASLGAAHRLPVPDPPGARNWVRQAPRHRP